MMQSGDSSSENISLVNQGNVPPPGNQATSKEEKKNQLIATLKSFCPALHIMYNGYVLCRFVDTLSMCFLVAPIATTAVCLGALFIRKLECIMKLNQLDDTKTAQRELIEAAYNSNNFKNIFFSNAKEKERHNKPKNQEKVKWYSNYFLSPILLFIGIGTEVSMFNKFIAIMLSGVIIAVFYSDTFTSHKDLGKIFVFFYSSMTSIYGVIGFLAAVAMIAKVAHDYGISIPLSWSIGINHKDQSVQAVENSDELLQIIKNSPGDLIYSVVDRELERLDFILRVIAIDNISYALSQACHVTQCVTSKIASNWAVPYANNIAEQGNTAQTSISAL